MRIYKNHEGQLVIDGENTSDVQVIKIDCSDTKVENFVIRTDMKGRGFYVNADRVEISDNLVGKF